jgi:hypothetical protein
LDRKFTALLTAMVAVPLFSPRAAGQDPAPAQAPVTQISAATPAPAGESPLPTTKELLDKFEKASGGHEALANLTTRYMKGIYQTEDESGFAAIEIFSKAPDKTYLKISLPNGMVMREVCDGKSAWMEDLSGRLHEFSGAELESRIRHANFSDQAQGILMALTGHVVRMEKVGEHTTYVVEYSPEKKTTARAYFDAESGFPVRTDEIMHRDGAEYRVETYLDDYRAVNGTYFPFRLRHVERGNVFTVRITQVKNNAPMDDTLFQRPQSARK